MSFFNPEDDCGTVGKERAVGSRETHWYTRVPGQFVISSFVLHCLSRLSAMSHSGQAATQPFRVKDRRRRIEMKIHVAREWSAVVVFLAMGASLFVRARKSQKV